MRSKKICKYCGEPVSVSWPALAYHKKCSPAAIKKYQQKYYVVVTKKNRQENKLKNNKNNFAVISPTGLSTDVDIKQISK